MLKDVKQPQATTQAPTIFIDGKPATQEEIERLTRIPARKSTTPRGDFQPKAFCLMEGSQEVQA